MRSCRCSRCATASARCRWLRRATTSASSTATAGRTPAAWAPTRRSPGSTERDVAEIADAVHQPVVELMRARGTPFHGVLYAGLMLTADGAAGARVQRALRRSRDAGGAAAAALRPARSCCSPPPDRAASPAPELEWVAGVGGHGRAGERRLPRLAPRRASRSRGLEARAGGRRGDARRHRPCRRSGASPRAAACSSVTGLGADAQSARAAAYAAAEMISFEGMQLRRDIAEQA